jgi:catechol 2,3-dioxygenase-like lactoylglutathione lyase family enzyme
MAISGAHVIVYSADPTADREFFRDVLGYPHVDAGGGWLIFKLPPAEVAVHPSDSAVEHELYLMCDDLTETMTRLRDSGVEFDEVAEARWGHLTRFRLPGGSQVGLYEPLHPRATELA